MLRDWALRVIPGSGLVARSRSTVVVVPDESATALVEKLLSAVAAHEERSSAGPISSRRLIRDIATVFAEEDDLPAFSVIADEGQGVALLLHGDMDALIAGPDDSSEEVSGRQSLTWVDRVLTEPLTELFVGARPTAAATMPFDLREGSVPGSGIALTARVGTVHETLDAGETTTSLGAARDPEALVSATATVPRTAADARPTSGSEPQAPEGPGDETGVLVKGVMCARGHFNRPTVSYCSVCGTSMLHLTRRLVDGPRPPLGILVLADGAMVPVDSDLVIGRDPGSHPDVVAGLAKPVIVDDPELRVSRAHALIRLDGWEVNVRDNGSSNGTAVAPPGEEGSVPVKGDDEVAITPGTKLILGGYTLIFNSSLH